MRRNKSYGYVREELSKQRNIYCQVPEMGTCQECLRNNKKVSVIGAE